MNLEFVGPPPLSENLISPCPEQLRCLRPPFPDTTDGTAIELPISWGDWGVDV